jgi:ABC-2 type transport system permease protein
MSKLKAIIKREYLTRVRSKGFIIGTALSPILMLSFVLVPFFVARLGSSAAYHVVVLDQSGDAVLYNRLSELINGQSSLNSATSERERPPSQMRQKRRQFHLEHQPVSSDAESNEAREWLGQQVSSGKIDAYVYLPPTALREERLNYYARNVGDLEGREQFRVALNRAVIDRRVSLAGLPQTVLENLTREIRFDIRNERGEVDRGQTMILAFGLLMIIYITILVYGVTVMRGVIEEKQSRIIEVLLSSVRPFDLMLGKLIGIGLVGLTQYFVWTVFGLLLGLLTSFPILVSNWQSLPRIEPILLFFFLVYFVLGYFLYATLYAMVGAMVTSEEDGQQMQLPVTMTIVVPMLVSTLVMRDPGGTAATVLSLIPFFSPMLMFLRIGLQTPPWWQIALSIVLLIGTILGAVWVAAKIYRVGVLMYGKRPTIPEIFRWLRYS